MTASQPALVRFSLRTLLVLMMLMCIALATTVSASLPVEVAIKWVSALAPAAAILLAAGTSGAKRAFLMGFAAIAIWLQLQLSHALDGKEYFQPKFARVFRKQFRDQLIEMHPGEIEDECARVLRSRFQNVFHRDPEITPEQIRVRHSSDYNLAKSWASENIVKRAGIIAWQWLYLIASLVGGLAVAITYERNHKERPQTRVIATPAAR